MEGRIWLGASTRLPVHANPYPTRQLPTLGAVYKDRDVINMDEDAFKSLVQQDRRMPAAPIWSLGHGK